MTSVSQTVCISCICRRLQSTCHAAYVQVLYTRNVLHDYCHGPYGTGSMLFTAGNIRLCSNRHGRSQTLLPMCNVNTYGTGSMLFPASTKSWCSNRHGRSQALLQVCNINTYVIYSKTTVKQQQPYAGKRHDQVRDVRGTSTAGTHCIKLSTI